MDFYDRFPILLSSKNDIEAAIEKFIECLSNGKKILICGNGGSCADALHIVGELQKGFLTTRPLGNLDRNVLKDFPDGNLLINKLQNGFPVYSLTSEVALITAISNDIGGEFIFAQQVWATGNPGDILLCISTSGNSKNVLLAAEVAKAKKMPVVSLTGNNSLAKLKSFSDIYIDVPSNKTYCIQELHLPIYHHICLTIEKHFFT